MNRAVLRLAGTVVLATLCFSQVFAQGRFDFDGVADMDPQPADPTDWDTSENWSEGGADPFGPPFGPLVPDFDIRVEITTSEVGVNAPVIGPGVVAEAFGVRIGRSDGVGLLTMTGGTLDLPDTCSALPFTCNRRIRVGNDDGNNINGGTFDLVAGTVSTDTFWIGSGSNGVVNVSGGVINTRGDFSLDWTFDSASELNLSGGTINVATSSFAPSGSQALRMYRNSVLNLTGGEILIDGRADLGIDSIESSAGGLQSPDVTVSISDGLLEASDLLRVNGTVTIDGGILRADSFSEVDSTGNVEINGGGLLQFNNSQESVAAVEALVTGGVINTSGAASLVVEIVDVGGTDFTQVSVASAGLPGDFDDDGDVDGTDFLVWQQGFPGTFDANDLVSWQNNYGPAPLAAAQTVPEPRSFLLALMTGLAALFRYRTNHYQLRPAYVRRRLEIIE